MTELKFWFASALPLAAPMFLVAFILSLFAFRRSSPAVRAFLISACVLLPWLVIISVGQNYTRDFGDAFIKGFVIALVLWLLGTIYFRQSWVDD